MKEFFENVPMNHWFTIATVVVTLASLFYVTIFYFSKEGKDERGRGIFASASAITFILMIILTLILDTNAKEWITGYRAFSIIINGQLAILLLCQVICIFILKKFR